jgi:hypothetical protein
MILVYGTVKVSLRNFNLSRSARRPAVPEPANYQLEIIFAFGTLAVAVLAAITLDRIEKWRRFKKIERYAKLISRFASPSAIATLPPAAVAHQRAARPGRPGSVQHVLLRLQYVM